MSDDAVYCIDCAILVSAAKQRPFSSFAKTGERFGSKLQIRLLTWLESKKVITKEHRKQLQTVAPCKIPENYQWLFINLYSASYLLLYGNIHSKRRLLYESIKSKWVDWSCNKKHHSKVTIFADEVTSVYVYVCICIYVYFMYLCICT